MTLIKALLKVSQQKYVEEMLKGRFRSQSLGFYSSLEQRGKVHHDKYEGCAAIFQKDYVTIQINQGSVARTFNSQSGLTEILLTYKAKLAQSCFSMHAIHLGKYSERMITEEEWPEFERSLQIDARMSEFGGGFDNAWVWYLFEPKEFLKRVVRFCKRYNHGLKQGLVTYKDLENMHGFIDDDTQGFVKPLKDEYQREYRLLFSGPEISPTDPFYFDLGDMSDISGIMSYADLISQFKIGYPAEAI